MEQRSFFEVSIFVVLWVRVLVRSVFYYVIISSQAPSCQKFDPMSWKINNMLILNNKKYFDCNRVRNAEMQICTLLTPFNEPYQQYTINPLRIFAESQESESKMCGFDYYYWHFLIQKSIYTLLLRRIKTNSRLTQYY